MLLDLNTMNIVPFLDDIFMLEERNSTNGEGWAARSPVRGFITFSVDGEFYAIDMKTKIVHPLGVQALNLSLYP